MQGKIAFKSGLQLMTMVMKTTVMKTLTLWSRIKLTNDNLADSEEEEDTPMDLVSHSDAANSLELALRYVGQHAAVTPTNQSQI